MRDLYSEENRVYEALLWDPRNIDDSDPKTEESRNLKVGLSIETVHYC